MVTVNEGITTGTDDGYGAITGGGSPSINLTGTLLLGGSRTARGSLQTRDQGIRFQTIAVPNASGLSGGVVDSATLTVNIENTAGNPETIVYADDVDGEDTAGDCPTWSTSSPDRPVRGDPTPTTAQVGFDPAGNGSADIDIASVVNEIVARAGWASGNNMRFLVEDDLDSGGTDTFDISASEHATNAEPALEIVYTAAAAGGIPPRGVNASGALGGVLINR